MVRNLRCLLAALTLAIGGQSAAAAAVTPTTNPGPSAKPSQAEALAFAKAYSPSDLRRAAELKILERDFLPTMAKDPSVGALLKAFPDLGPALVQAMAGQLDLYIEEYDERFLPRMAAIVQKHLTRDDVASLTTFYASPVGRKFLELNVSNVDGSEVAEAALQGKDMSQEAIDRQVIRAGVASYLEASPEDREQLRAVLLSPAGRRLSAMRPEILALQQELMNSPGPRFKAAAEKAMQAAFERHVVRKP